MPLWEEISRPAKCGPVRNRVEASAVRSPVQIPCQSQWNHWQLRGFFEVCRKMYCESFERRAHQHIYTRLTELSLTFYTLHITHPFQNLPTISSNTPQTWVQCQPGAMLSLPLTRMYDLFPRCPQSNFANRHSAHGEESPRT